MPRCFVREKLFLGNIEDAVEVFQNGRGEITHVLSLLSSASASFFSDWRSELSIRTEEIRKVLVGETECPYGSDDEFEGSPKKALHPERLLYSLEHAGPELKLVRMAVPLRDMEEENLLDYLDAALDFIEKCRNKEEGSVLVHCFAGVSRSAAVMTAYLMRSEQKSLEDALESLRKCCEYVCPNDGFLDQLKMFEDMGFKVDRSSSIYKRFRLKILGDYYYRGRKVDGSIFGADPGLPQESNSEESSPRKNEKSIIYRCKKCRRIVSLQENVVCHEPGEGETCFQWKKRSSGSFQRSGESDCSSLFVEPLQWMTSVAEGSLEGKLSCIHCGARLGYFNWSGIQCNCGSWITPAFQIHKGRVDVSKV